MKKIAELRNVARFVVEGGIVFLISLDLDYPQLENENRYSILADGNTRTSHFFRFKNYWLRTFKDFGQIHVYDNNLQCVNVFDEGFNLPSSKFMSSGDILIPNKISKTHWRLTGELEISDTSRLIKYENCINGKYFNYRYPPNIITKINLDNYEEKIAWQINLADHLRIEGDDELTLRCAPLGYDDLIFFPFEKGEILAINFDTNSIEWEIKDDLSGIISVYRDKLYKKNNKLYQISAKTGEIEIEKLISDIVGRTFYATGRIISCEDVIILWDVTHSEVVIINRNDFLLIDCIRLNSIGIGNQEGVIEWHDNKLYVLDMERTLHIFERD